MSEPIISRKTATILAVACAFSLVTGILYLVLGPELSSPPSAASDSYSRSAVGHKAFVELLKSLDVPVVATRANTATRARASSLLVVAEPDLRDGDKDRIETLRQMLDHAPRVLLVLPKWTAIEEGAMPGWIVDASPRAEWVVESVLQNVGKLQSIARPGSVSGPWSGLLDASPTLEHPQLLKPTTGLSPLVSAAEGVLLGRIDRRGSHVYVLSDPDVIETHGLHRGDNALLAARIVDFAREGHEGPVLVDETLHGFELEPSAWRELFRFPMALGLVQALIAALALLWAGMARFGAPVPPPPAIEPGKRFLVESTAELLLRGGHSPHALERYLAGTVQEVARGTHAPPTLTQEALREWLARVADARGVKGSVDGLEREVAAASAAGAKEPRRIVAAALSVHGWRKEMIDGPVRDS